MEENKNQQMHFDHSEWLDNTFKLMDTAQEFFREVGETVKILMKKGFSKGKEEIRFFISKSTVLDYICGGLNAAAGFLAVLFSFSGFGLLGYQVFFWLKDGVWTEFPLLVVFNALFENTALGSWISHPESWYGLQTVTLWILENVPLSLALIVLGLIGAIMAAAVMITAIMIRFYQFKTPGKQE